MALLFVYGTLLNSATREYVFGHDNFAPKCAFISGWEKQPIRPKSTIFMARRNNKAQIRGKILVVSRADLECADYFESEGSLYQRHVVKTQKGILVFMYGELDHKVRYW